ncbi:MAG: hypothetical protein IJK58_01265 [Clostridia bacterium]|nr:hypothetical protein [Clostridia bacterium]
MKLPALRVLKRTRRITSAFGGLDRRPVTPDGRWSDMKNMTGDGYPTVAVREKRGTVEIGGEGEITGIGTALGAPAVTRGSTVVVGDTVVDVGLSSGRKTLVTMGAYLLIFPDGKYVNAASVLEGGEPEWGDIDASLTVTSEGEEPNAATLFCSTCDADGNAIDYSRSVTTPPAPENGDFWYDIGSTPAVLKQYRADTDEWVEFEPYRKFRFDRNISLPLSVGETVFIEPEIFRTEGGTDGSPARGFFKLVKKGSDHFVIPGPVINRIYDGFTVSISRKVPEMDFVTEAGNRLWGCRYGEVDGKLVNEIYASALGDFREWHTFENVSTDSYAASIGSDGPFTGAATYRGNPVFFKERCAHRVMGTSPSTFRIVTLECDGAELASGRSLVTVGGLLYYVSASGVMRYDGSSAEKVSAALGDGLFSATAAGEYGGKYYVCLSGAADGLFVFDPRRGTWHREDETKAAGFCSACADTFFFRAGDTALTSVGGMGTPAEGPLSWFLESGDLGLSSPDKKYPSRVTVGMRLAVGTEARIFIRYDGEGDFVPAASAEGRGLGSFSAVLPLRRCDSFRIRISGVGDAAIHSIALTSGEGSENDRR